MESGNSIAPDLSQSSQGKKGGSQVKPSPQTVTRWLSEWSSGDEAAFNKASSRSPMQNGARRFTGARVRQRPGQ